MPEDGHAELLISLTSDIVIAQVSNSEVEAEALPSLIQNVYAALAGLGAEAHQDMAPEPAVSIRASVKKEHIVCLEDGKKMKMLRRHLMTDHGMTPEEYRERWNLPADYPMVAPDYADKRRDLAKKIGLGRKSNKARSSKKATK
ncbi:MucR family transcriptional regulator [Aurantiacibacter hainanensis]|uniref:MucR family transcriptional regulator n=1 Tax=Aurantiacibacter hainanensis TaxID=3076114 RepID=UPI0030C76AC7